MKKEYREPDLCILTFEAEDILTASGYDGGDDRYEGEIDPWN